MLMPDPDGTSPSHPRERWLAIGLVTLAALLAYGPLLTRLGFYRDDWYQIWAGLTHGYRSIITLFSIDRPAMGYTYAAAFYLLRDVPLAWQVYALFLRWVGALAALWFLRRTWPGRPWMTTSAALLFLVYPGFLQQPNANTFSNHLFGYAAGILSLAATAEAIHSDSGRRRAAFTALAVVGAVTCWMIYEYMIGLEAARYLVLARDRLRKSGGTQKAWVGRWLRASLPYLVPVIAYLGWRLFVFRATRMGVDVGQVLAEYGSSPFATLLQRIAGLLWDFVESAFLAWAVPVYQLVDSLGLVRLLWGVIPAALAGLVFILYVRQTSNSTGVPSYESSPREERDLLAFGAFATLAALIPVVLLGRDVRWSSAFDRYTLHATLGLGMFIAGMVFTLVRSQARLVVISALIGLSVFTHQANAQHWARFWEEQRQLWWQMVWRAPALEHGTVLVVNLPSQRYFEDYEVWAPANLIYAPERSNPVIAAEVIAEETVRKVLLAWDETRAMRVFIEIPRDYARTLVVDWPSGNACVHLVDGNQPELPSSSGSLMRAIAPYSRADLILTDAPAASPPERIFGREPTHGWCWYYQAASLARQRGDWERVVELANEAETLGFSPGDVSEWMPFFHGYLNTGDEAGARRLAAFVRGDEIARRELCSGLAQTYFLDRATFDLGTRLLCD
ncbi:MAG TPA: hypothetical protein VFI11_03325 [Anaerolineales bacterium]|nr:hypothetical protein [Anaerolineales bacterium]